MNILITNVGFDFRSGTVTFVRDLATKLRALGHYPMIYSPSIGNIADETRYAGVPVVSDLKDVPRKPDIIHGHHHIQTVNAFLNFPGVPGIFVCHDRLSTYDVPPIYRRVHCYVAVDYNCRERLANAGISEERIRVIFNSVDSDKFLPRATLPSYPKRALVFSNYASRSNYFKPIINACKKLNIKLDIIGSLSGKSTDHPEKILGYYDLVFAKARCAIEAMACGAAVILCDYRGLGPMVTINEVEDLRLWNFGMRTLKYPINEALIIRQIERYNQQDARDVSSYIHRNATLTNMAEEYLNLYQKALSSVSEDRTEVSDEFKVYLGALYERGKEYNLVSLLDKARLSKWIIADYIKHFTQLLFIHKKIWKIFPKLYKRIVFKRKRVNNIIFSAHQGYNSVLLNQARGIEKMLVRIARKEIMALRYVHK